MWRVAADERGPAAAPRGVGAVCGAHAATVKAKLIRARVDDLGRLDVPACAGDMSVFGVCHTRGDPIFRRRRARVRPTREAASRQLQLESRCRESTAKITVAEACLPGRPLRNRARLAKEPRASAGASANASVPFAASDVNGTSLVPSGARQRGSPLCASNTCKRGDGQGYADTS